jgi:hypothetical protein
MPSTRLHIDPEARTITARAAASAEAPLIQTAATAPAESVSSAVGAVAVPNTFNLAASGLTTRANAVNRVVATAVAARGGAVGAVSTTGFNALDMTNEINAVDLRTVAEQR